MSTRYRAAKLIILLSLACGIWGCESSDVQPQDGAELTVSATPEVVVIDLDAGEFEGDTIIEARLFEGAFAVQNTVVTFTSNGGTLESSDNRCQLGSNTCKQTGGACTSNGVCPAVVPEGRKTDGNGVARDRLFINQGDPGTVDVTVRSGTLSATVAVTKNLRTDLTASIVASPPDSQQTGLTVFFDGSGSINLSGEITCYQWEIQGLPGVGYVDQGEDLDMIMDNFALEQSLTVILRLSEDPNARSLCQRGLPPVPLSFFTAEAQLFYDIVCDPTAPDVNAGNNQQRTIDLGEPVIVTWTGTASDPDSGIEPSSEQWQCGNAANDVVAGTTANCTYTPTQTGTVQFTATFSAENTCGQQASDTALLTVTVNQP